MAYTLPLGMVVPGHWSAGKQTRSSRDQTQPSFAKMTWVRSWSTSIRVVPALTSYA